MSPNGIIPAEDATEARINMRDYGHTVRNCSEVYHIDITHELIGETCI